MASVPEYKIIQGNNQTVESQLNQLAADGWRPITATSLPDWQFIVILQRQK